MWPSAEDIARAADVPANDGGESIMVDGFQAAAQLQEGDPQAFALLCRYAQDFNRIHPGSLDQRGRQPMIVLDDRDAVVGIRFHTRSAGPLNLPTDVVKPYYEAHRRLCERLFDPANQLRFQLEDELLDHLLDDFTDRQIADRLNEQGLHSGCEQAFHPRTHRRTV